MNQSMRPQDLREFRKLPAGSKKKPATCELVALLLKVSASGFNSPSGEMSRLSLSIRDERTRFIDRLLLRGVIRLAKLISEGFDEMGSLTLKDQR
jgi:hypothetical protein